MPSNFFCRGCGLRFTLGWFDDGPHAAGYGATTRLVCVKCGTEHAIEIALRDRGPRIVRRFDVSLIRIEESKRVEALHILTTRFDMDSTEANDALGEIPLVIASRADSMLADELTMLFQTVGSVEVKEVGSIPNPLYGPMRQDRFLSGRRPRFDDVATLAEITPTGARLGPNGELDLEIQVCASCGARGSLEGNPGEIGRACPHCGRISLECSHC
jgi:hypothetical protein